MALIGSLILDNAAHRRPGSEAVFFRAVQMEIESGFSPSSQSAARRWCSSHRESGWAILTAIPSPQPSRTGRQMVLGNR
jgi:hypothetical protein